MFRLVLSKGKGVLPQLRQLRQLRPMSKLAPKNGLPIPADVAPTAPIQGIKLGKVVNIEIYSPTDTMQRTLAILMPNSRKHSVIGSGVTRHEYTAADGTQFGLTSLDVEQAIRKGNADFSALAAAFTPSKLSESELATVVQQYVTAANVIGIRETTLVTPQDPEQVAHRIASAGLGFEKTATLAGNPAIWMRGLAEHGDKFGFTNQLATELNPTALIGVGGDAVDHIVQNQHDQVLPSYMSLFPENFWGNGMGSAMTLQVKELFVFFLTRVRHAEYPSDSRYGKHLFPINDLHPLVRDILTADIIGDPTSPPSTAHKDQIYMGLRDNATFVDPVSLEKRPLPAGKVYRGFQQHTALTGNPGEIRQKMIEAGVPVSPAPPAAYYGQALRSLAQQSLLPVIMERFFGVDIPTFPGRDILNSEQDLTAFNYQNATMFMQGIGMPEDEIKTFLGQIKQLEPIMGFIKNHADNPNSLEFKTGLEHSIRANIGRDASPAELDVLKECIVLNKDLVAEAQAYGLQIDFSHENRGHLLQYFNVMSDLNEAEHTGLFQEFIRRVCQHKALEIFESGGNAEKVNEVLGSMVQELQCGDFGQKSFQTLMKVLEEGMQQTKASATDSKRKLLLTEADALNNPFKLMETIVEKNYYELSKSQQAAAKECIQHMIGEWQSANVQAVVAEYRAELNLEKNKPKNIVAIISLKSGIT